MSRPAPLVLAALLLASCGRDRPGGPGTHALRGHVVLVGHLVDGSGTFAGTRVVGDADGVAVELLYGTQVIARTTTIGGVYAFSGLGAGAYVARSFVNGPIGDRTQLLTIVDSDLAVGDTLRLESLGDLYPVPNPVGAETFVYFTLPDSERVDLEILSMAGDTVKTLLRATRPAGQNQVRWDGTDRSGAPSTAPLVWITFMAVPDSAHPAIFPDHRAQLLFHAPPAPRP
jgi:hypothetical protein